MIEEDLVLSISWCVSFDKPPSSCWSKSGTDAPHDAVAAVVHSPCIAVHGLKVFFLKEDGTFLKVGLFYNTRKDLAFQYYRNLIIDFLIGDFLNPGHILVSLLRNLLSSRLYDELYSKP